MLESLVETKQPENVQKKDLQTIAYQKRGCFGIFRASGQVFGVAMEKQGMRYCKAMGSPTRLGVIERDTDIDRERDFYKQNTLTPAPDCAKMQFLRPPSRSRDNRGKCIA